MSSKPKDNNSKYQVYYNSNSSPTKSNQKYRYEELSDSRIITKDLVYVIGLSTSIANKETLIKFEYFGQYGTIIKIVVNKNKAYNLNKPNGPSYSAYITYSKPTEAAIAILSVDETIVDNHLIRAFFGTTKYCSFFLKGIECTNKDCVFLHKIANNIDIIKRGDLTSNKIDLEKQHYYAIEIADVYNPEVKKKLLNTINKNTIFPSPNMIYKCNFIIDNDINQCKKHSSFKKNNKSFNNKDFDKIKEENKSKNIKDKNINEIEISKEDKTHRLFLSKGKSRFDFTVQKNSNNKINEEKIEVPPFIQGLITKKINLFKLTKYMHHQIIDSFLANEEIIKNNKNIKQNEWIDFIKNNECQDINNINKSNPQNDEYINDFDKITSFILKLRQSEQ